MKNTLFSPGQIRYLEKVAKHGLSRQSNRERQCTHNIRRKTELQLPDYLWNHLKEWMLVARCSNAVVDLRILDRDQKIQLQEQVAHRIEELTEFLHTWLPPEKTRDFLIEYLYYYPRKDLRQEPLNPILVLRAFEEYLNAVRFENDDLEKARSCLCSALSQISKSVSGGKIVVSSYHSQDEEFGTIPKTKTFARIERPLIVSVYHIPARLENDFDWLVNGGTKGVYNLKWIFPIGRDIHAKSNVAYFVRLNLPISILRALRRSNKQGRYKTMLIGEVFYELAAELKVSASTIIGPRESGLAGYIRDIARSLEMPPSYREIDRHIAGFTDCRAKGGGLASLAGRCMNEMAGRGLIQRIQNRVRMREKGADLLDPAGCAVSEGWLAFGTVSGEESLEKLLKTHEFRRYRPVRPR